MPAQEKLMPKKKRIFTLPKIRCNAPVTIAFILICTVILAVETIFHTELIAYFFTTGGAHKSPAPFNAAYAFDYARLFLHVFGNSDRLHFISEAVFILLLGPSAEEKYGSFLLVLMLAVAAAFSGVLNACFSPIPLTGSGTAAFLLAFLFLFSTRKKNEVPLSYILIFILYAGKIIADIQTQRNIIPLIQIAGGLCGSLLSFFAVPQKKTQTKSTAAKTPAATRKYPEPVPAPEIQDDTVIGAL